MSPKCWIVIAAATLLLGGACEDDAFEFEVLPLPADPAAYDPIESYDYMEIPADNPLTAEKAALGRYLYGDPRLSGDGTRSCYSCHVREFGLTDGLPKAIGAYQKQLTRSSPTMWNVGYHQSWYWDGRAASLEVQALKAWTGGNMGAKDTAPVLAAINAIPEYADQFEQVFGGAADEDNVPKALAAYMRTLISNGTAWDRFMAGETSALDDAQQRGWALFQEEGCVDCHAGVLLTDLQFHNVGIGMDAAEPDVGRFKVTQRDRDMGAFKTPTLRDISKSAPYFHDGSVATLEAAVRLMAGGGIDNPHLSRDKLSDRQLTDAQIADLLAFLGALDQPAVAAVRPPKLP